MSARDRLIAAAVGVSALGTLLGGLTSVGDLREEQRRAELAAAERAERAREQKAVAAYQQSLTPLALGVYDVVQPLQLAYGDLDDGDVDAVDVLIDVGLHVSSPAGLDALRARLEALEAPASLRDEHASLVTAVDDMTKAAATVRALDESDDEDTYADVVADGDLALDDATRDWIRPITPIFQGAAAPAVPVVDGVEGQRTPLSRSEYLRVSGNLCSNGINALEATGADKEEPSLTEIRAGLDELDQRVAELLTVKAPTADDRTVASTIRAPLRRTPELKKGFIAALAALERADAAGVRAGQAQLARGEVAAEKAASGYRAYGSKICALYLVGLEEGASAGADGPQAT